MNFEGKKIMLITACHKLFSFSTKGVKCAESNGNFGLSSLIMN